MRAADLPGAIAARVWLELSEFRPAVILTTGWLLFVVYAYPGLMSMDSFDQLGEARAWFFTDSHPPAMALLWGVVDRIVPGPFGMLAIQSSAFLIGIYLILRRAMRHRRAALWACAVFLFPPVLAPMTVIWKDCLMAGFLVLGIPAILDDRRSVRLLGIASFTVATAMRYNALAATLPLIVLLFQWRPGQRALARYAIAAVTWLVLTLVALGADLWLTDRPMYFWSSSMALADIVGTLAKVEVDVPDAELVPLLAPTGLRIDHDLHATFRAKYQPAEFTQLIGGDQPLWIVPINGIVPAPEAQREAVGHAWTEIIQAHPAAYLRYRFETFGEVLGLWPKFKGLIVMQRKGQTGNLLDDYGIPMHKLKFQRVLENGTVLLAKKTHIYRPRGYALLALLLIAVAWRQRDVLAILASGLIMELSLLPLAATPDYRYSHWMVTCTCLAVVMLVARRARQPAPA